MGNYFIYSDIAFDQNQDYTYTDIYDPAGVSIDLSTYTAQAMIRVNKTDVSALMTFANGSGLVLNAGSVTGAVQWNVTNTQISTLFKNMPGLKAFFNIILIAPGTLLHIPFKAGALTLIRGADWT